MWQAVRHDPCLTQPCSLRSPPSIDNIKQRISGLERVQVELVTALTDLSLERKQAGPGLQHWAEEELPSNAAGNSLEQAMPLVRNSGAAPLSVRHVPQQLVVICLSCQLIQHLDWTSCWWMLAIATSSSTLMACENVMCCWWWATGLQIQLQATGHQPCLCRLQPEPQHAHECQEHAQQHAWHCSGRPTPLESRPTRWNIATGGEAPRFGRSVGLCHISSPPKP